MPGDLLWHFSDTKEKNEMKIYVYTDDETVHSCFYRDMDIRGDMAWNVQDYADNRHWRNISIRDCINVIAVQLAEYRAKKFGGVNG